MKRHDEIGIDEVFNALVSAVSEGALEGDWTNRVLDSLAKLGRTRDLCVEPLDLLAQVGGGRKAGEYLWDLTISEWPVYGDGAPYRYPEYYEAAGEAPHGPRLLMVAECEWGEPADKRSHGRAVMEDFAKLLAARAPLKVMVFGYTTKGRKLDSSFEELHRLMARLVAVADDPAVYCLFGVSWHDSEYAWQPVDQLGTQYELVRRTY